MKNNQTETNKINHETQISSPYSIVDQNKHDATRTGRTNSMAVASFILALSGTVIPILPTIPAVIVGFVALSQIRDNPGSSGRGLAIAGIIIGMIINLFSLLILLVVLAYTNSF